MDLREKAHWLGQYRHLRGEMDQLSRRIDGLEREGGGGRGEADAAALRDRLLGRYARCRDQMEATEAYIDAIDDSLMRQIMTCRYIDGDPWRCVAARIGERDEQYPRRLHNRYLARHELPAALGPGGGNIK